MILSIAGVMRVLNETKVGQEDPEALWLVVSSGGSDTEGLGWASLVAASVNRDRGEFCFEFDGRLRLGDSVLIRYLEDSLGRMVSVPALVAVRQQRPGEVLYDVRVISEKCVCGFADCGRLLCYDAGRFVREEPLRVREEPLRLVA